MFVECQRNDQTDFQVLLLLRYNEKDRILDRGYFFERIRERLWTGHPLGQYVRGKKKSQLSTKLKNIHIYECAFLQ